MKKERTIQKNFRLPESLVNDLDLVTREAPETVTDVVRTGIQARVNRLKRQIERRKERETATA